MALPPSSKRYAIAAYKAQARNIQGLRAMNTLNLFSSPSLHIRKMEFAIIIATAMVGGHQMLLRTHVLSPFDKESQVERASATIARQYLEGYAHTHHASSLEEHTKAANYSQTHKNIQSMRENVEHSPSVHLSSQSVHSGPGLIPQQRIPGL